jgi:adenosine deaminase
MRWVIAEIIKINLMSANHEDIPGSSMFIDSLEKNNLKKLRLVPKSDLHNHGMMGGRLSTMEKLCGMKLGKFKAGNQGIFEINDWIGNVYRPIFDQPGIFENAMKAMFMQAKHDGVTILEMSIDIYMGRLLNLSPAKIIETLDHVHKAIAPEIDFRPELGFNRTFSVRSLLSAFEPYLEFSYFKAIDLYDDESAQPVRNFFELFRFAKNRGYKCKAHAGEFGDAESVREAVEILDLDAVQHGIGAAESKEVMNWLADHKIPLHTSPVSNIGLKRVKSYQTHPIRILYDHGVKVTINTDDVMLFDKGNSEQYLKLYNCGLFTAGELDEIRMNGLI